jgi:hypothetical protein
MLIVRNRFQPLPQYPVDFESQPKVAGVMTGRASAIKTVRPVFLVRFRGQSFFANRVQVLSGSGHTGTFLT